MGKLFLINVLHTYVPQKPTGEKQAGEVKEQQYR